MTAGDILRVEPERQYGALAWTPAVVTVLEVTLRNGREVWIEAVDAHGDLYSFDRVGDRWYEARRNSVPLTLRREADGLHHGP